MQNRRDFLTGVGLAAVVVAAFGRVRPARADTCSVCKTTSILLPLSCTFFAPVEPCVPNGENVSLAGDVHVVTKVRQNWVTDVHLNMAGVDGLGQTSKSLYIGTGSAKFIGLQGPNIPAITAMFTLETTNGCASVPLPVTFQAFFSNDGTLLAGESAVSIGSVIGGTD